MSKLPHFFMVVSLCYLLLFAAIPAQAGLVAYWDFNDGSGSTATDVARGRTGNLTNMDAGSDWVAGRTGAPGDFALDFDGGDDYINVPTYKGQAGRSARTISAWINSSGTNDDIVSYGANNNAEKLVFRTNSDNGNSDTLRVEVNGGYQVGSTDIVGEGWTHVAMTWEDDGSANVNDLKLYVNGVLESNSATQGNNLNTNTSQDFRIGGENWDTSRNFLGQIDDVAVWNRVLTDAEIAQIAGGLSPTALPDAVPKAALDYNAASDPDPTNGQWEDLTNLSGNHDWAINNNAGGARWVDVQSRNFQVEKAYSFNGTTDTATTSDAESFPGNLTNDSASFEILFRPSDTTGKEILYETGGTTGMSLAIDGTSLLFSTAQNSATSTTQLSYDGVSEEFMHAVGVIERVNGGAELSLYVNGELVDFDTSTLTDWAGSNTAGLGQINGGTAGGDFGGLLSGFGNFEGYIATFRLYDTVLTPGDIRALYDSVAAVPEPSTMVLGFCGLVGLGLVALRRRRRK